MRTALLLMTCLVTAACGMKGDLYEPAPAATAPETTPTAAPTTPPTPPVDPRGERKANPATPDPAHAH
ncbi:MAG: hypothetical protein DYH20_04120 [Gammaproteobacteria bacterium PRO9]|nr:hypothetical protein [Gammaproteobacteria bacterium PRO9]